MEKMFSLDMFNQGSEYISDLRVGDLFKTEPFQNAPMTQSGAKAAEYFAERGWTLVYFSIFDEDDRRDPVHLHVGVPEPIALMCEQFASCGGCPLARECVKAVQPFDAIDHDYSAYQDDLSRRYLEAFENLGYARMIAIPVQIGKGIAILTLGGNPQSNGTMPEDLVITAAYQLMIAMVARHPEIEAYFEAKKLTRREAEVLSLSASGYGEAHVAQALNISPNTVRTHIENAKRSLGARNKAHAVALAIQSREISLFPL